MTWHLKLIQQYLNSPGQNDADRYGISIIPANLTPGQAKYWRVIGIHHLTGPENGGNHHVFVDVLNEAGNRINGARINILTNGKPRGFMVTDKPPNEPGSNTQMHWNDTLTVSVAGDISGEQVTGLHTRHEDEPPGNTRGHHSFYVVWQLQAVTEPEEPEQPEEPGPTPTPSDWRAKLGVGQLWLLEQHLRLRNSPEGELIVRMAGLLDGNG